MAISTSSTASDHEPKVPIRLIWKSVISRLSGTPAPPHTIVPVSPPLTYLADAVDSDWLVASLTTFGHSVGSFLPTAFEAYARVYHAIQSNRTASDPLPRLHALAETHRIDLRDSAAVSAFFDRMRSDFWVETGSLSLRETSVLLEHLGPATETADHCRFALWYGFGDSLVPADVRPTLQLPGRAYHMFSGPIGGAKINLSSSTLTTRSANLWWPADHAWCVATEIDLPWTYVGGSRACIDRLVDDGRLDAQRVAVAAHR